MTRWPCTYARATADEHAALHISRRVCTINTALCTCASGPMHMSRAVCLCAEPFVYVQKPFVYVQERFVYVQSRLFMCSAVCLYAAPFVYMQRRLLICSAVCLYATPTANLQSGVQICKATCSCARVGFRKYVVFSMTHKSQAPDEFVVARRVAARIQQFVLLYPASGPGRERDRK